MGAVALLVGMAGVAAANDARVAALAGAAPRIDREVLRLALLASDCAAARDGRTATRLAVIDYSRPSTEERLWVFDLERRTLLFEELVAHGRNSGDERSHAFSNRPGSRQTSLGLFRTRDVYRGRHGTALRLEGLEAGTNDRALERAIVVHGARYVNPAGARRLGRLGHSWGCPAVRAEVAPRLIDTIKDGQLLFAYYPDPGWLRRSPFLTCAARGRVAGHRGTVKEAS